MTKTVAKKRVKSKNAKKSTAAAKKATQKRGATKSPKSGTGTGRTVRLPASAATRKKRIVRGLLKQFAKQQADDDVKLTVTEAIRLMQLDNEIEAGQPREVVVRWVDDSSPETDSSKT